MIRTVPADADVVHITFADGSNGLVLPAWRAFGTTGTAAYVLNPATHENHGFIKRQVTVGELLYDISCEIVVLQS
jgi:hypothetical protein